MTAIAVEPYRPAVGPARVHPLDALRQTGTLAWRTLVQIRHNPMELMDYSVQPLMFVLLFTYVFGGAVSGSTGAYLAFALPGIIVQNALFTTLNTGAAIGFRIHTGPFGLLGAFVLLVLAALAVSWMSVLVGMLVSEPERVMVFGFTVMFP